MPGSGQRLTTKHPLLCSHLPRKPIPSSCEGCGRPWEGEVLRPRARDWRQGSGTSDLHSGLQSSWPGPSAGGRAGTHRYGMSGVKEGSVVRFREALLTLLCLCPGVAEPVEVRDNGDGTHTVHYTPATDGPYTVAVKYADQEVPRR